MKELQDTCFVLRTGHFRESDIWLKVLSPKFGLLTLFAFGGAKSKRRFCGCLDILNILECRIKLSGGQKYYILEEAKLLTGPENLREDWRGMGIVRNCSCFLENLELDPESCLPTFNLLENMLSTMKNCKDYSSLFVLFFRFHLACLLGFNPDLEKCGACGTSSIVKAYFAYDEGRIYCRECQTSLPLQRKIGISNRGLDVLRRVKHTFPSFWPVEITQTEDRRACAQAMDRFVQYHLGIAYTDGFFKRV